MVGLSHPSATPLAPQPLGTRQLPASAQQGRCRPGLGGGLLRGRSAQPCPPPPLRPRVPPLAASHCPDRHRTGGGPAAAAAAAAHTAWPGLRRVGAVAAAVAAAPSLTRCRAAASASASESAPGPDGDVEQAQCASDVHPPQLQQPLPLPPAPGPASAGAAAASADAHSSATSRELDAAAAAGGAVRKGAVQQHADESGPAAATAAAAPASPAEGPPAAIAATVTGTWPPAEPPAAAAGRSPARASAPPSAGPFAAAARPAAAHLAAASPPAVGPSAAAARPPAVPSAFSNAAAARPPAAPSATSNTAARLPATAPPVSRPPGASPAARPPAAGPPAATAPGPSAAASAFPGTRPQAAAVPTPKAPGAGPAAAAAATPPPAVTAPRPSPAPYAPTPTGWPQYPLSGALRRASAAGVAVPAARPFGAHPGSNPAGPPAASSAGAASSPSATPSAPPAAMPPPAAAAPAAAAPAGASASAASTPPVAQPHPAAAPFAAARQPAAGPVIADGGALPAVPSAAAVTAAAAPAATPPAAAPPPLSVFSLPGMDLAGPAGRQASADELLAAVAAAEPDQNAVWYAVEELLPYLLSITNTGPLRGFAFDVEASDGNWREDHIIELAVVDLATGDAFSSFVNPHGRGRDFPLNPRIVSLTGITPAMLRPAPGPHWVALAFLCWLYQRCRAAGGARPTLLGHSVKSFDRYFLARALGAQGCLLPPSWCVVDTCSIATRWKVTAATGHTDTKLQTLREMYGIPEQTAHRALPDTWVNVAVLAAMLRRHKYGGGDEGGGGGAWQQQGQGQGQVEDGLLVQQALNDGTLAFSAESDAIGQLLPWGDGTNGARELLKVLGGREPGAAHAGERDGGMWSAADVLLAKTARARAIAAGHMPSDHGPDFHSAPVAWSVRHPEHVPYYLPQPHEPLPVEPPKRKRRPRLPGRSAAG